MSGGRQSSTESTRITMVKCMENCKHIPSGVKTRGRESNVELLRIFSMLGVIILHYNNESMGGGLKFVSFGSTNYWILSVLESIFVCAVDLFILISGYFMIGTQKRNVIKPVKLIVQVIAFKLGIYLVMIVLGQASFSLSQIASALIPNNYFVILYVALYFISPYINIVLKSLNNKQLKRFIIIVVAIFSVYVTIVDVVGHLFGKEINGLSSISAYGSQDGYTIVNFILMYVIGAFIKINDDRIKKIKLNKLIVCFILLVVVSVAWSYVYKLSGITKSAVYSYCNPVVIVLAIIAFVVFQRIKLGNNRVINNFAKSCFTVFLAHSYFLGAIRIERFVCKNPFILIAHIFVSVIAIYLICWIIHCVYELVTSPIYRLIDNRIGSGTYAVTNEK